MNESMAWIVAVVLIVAIVVCGGSYLIKTSNDQYYAAFNLCVNNGGTWVPSTGNTGVCLRK